MSIENPPAEVAELRDQAYHDGTYDADAVRRYMDAREKTLAYFRLNIWGMGEYREAMNTAHMLFFAEDGSSYPNHTEFAIPRDDDGQLIEDSEQYQAYRAAVTAYIEHDHGHVGIPVHKLGSNDGWLVTPAECEGAIEAWEQYVDSEHDGVEGQAAIALRGEDDADYWLRWIQFLRVASNGGGFRVY
jgi:hypothetical protein